MPTRYQGSESEQRALNTVIKLLRASDTVSACVNTQITGYGLTISQFGVLEALYHLGPLPPSTLARKILKSVGNMTMVIDHLERDGYVERHPSETDRRSVTVHLTGKGAATVAAVFPGHARFIASLMGALTPDEQEQLGTLCRKLGRTIQEQQSSDAST